MNKMSFQTLKSMFPQIEGSRTLRPTTKKPYNMAHTKMRRKMERRSQRINRGQRKGL